MRFIVVEGMHREVRLDPTSHLTAVEAATARNQERHAENVGQDSRCYEQRARYEDHYCIKQRFGRHPASSEFGLDTTVG